MEVDSLVERVTGSGRMPLHVLGLRLDGIRQLAGGRWSAWCSTPDGDVGYWSGGLIRQQKQWRASGLGKEPPLLGKGWMLARACAALHCIKSTATDLAPVCSSMQEEVQIEVKYPQSQSYFGRP